MSWSFRDIVKPQLNNGASLLETLSVGTAAASVAYYAGRHYSSLSGGQSLGYGLLGACLSLALAEGYEKYEKTEDDKKEPKPLLLIFFLAIGPFITEAFGENVFHHSLFVKDIVIVAGAALATAILMVHMFNGLRALQNWWQTPT